MAGSPRIANDPPAPATIVILGGDVHNAYIADVAVGPDQKSRVVQIVCSPFRNPLSASQRRVVRLTASAPSAKIFGLLARLARVPDLSADWRLVRGQTFHNSLGELELDERAARVRLSRSPREDEQAEQLQTLDETVLWSADEQGGAH